jgi:hypothetical protein
MWAAKFRVASAALAIIAAIISLQQCGRSRQPRIVLWAWERPENLGFINPRAIAVAFLAQTIRLRATETHIKPRLQSLKFAPGTELIAVVRIETEHATLSPTQLEATVSAIQQLTRPANLSAIQIDFDARQSEREFYRELLQALRRALPSKLRLSITALASWCIHDDWLTGLPINEAVPMLFRLGVERNEVHSYIASGKTFRCSLCQHSLGISTDEPFAHLPARNIDSIYVFNPQPWSVASVNKVLQEWQQ